METITNTVEALEENNISLKPQNLGGGHNLLMQWADFADIQNKISMRINGDLTEISSLTEGKTIELSHQFQILANAATEQVNLMHQLSGLAKCIRINEHEIEVSEITRLLQETFINSITCILEMSKQAMVMIYSLDDAIRTLGMIEKSIREIEKINHKTKYLSLNATIEAVRAGESGESFQVVASEVRDLSNDTQTLATNIRDQVNHLSGTLQEAQDILQSVAKIDMTSNLMAKDQLDDMINGLVDNSFEMSDIMQLAMHKSQEFSNTASQLITSIQFQDRVKQDFDRITRDLNHVMSVSEHLKNSTFSTLYESSNISNAEIELLADVQAASNKRLLEDLREKGLDKSQSLSRSPDHVKDTNDGSSAQDDVTLF
jgi:methyl-accepting chemotaxis protein